MKKNSILICVILFLISQSRLALAQSSDPRTIAVLYFENNSIAKREQLEPLKKGLASMLITEISQIQAFKVVEREKLESLLNEMSLGETGVIDESTAQQIGKLLGAQSLLLGGFINMFGDQFRIDIRIVEVETGLTLRAEEETGRVDELFDMIKKLTKKITKYFEVNLTKDDKQRLKEHTGSENLDAAILYSKGLDFEDLGRRYNTQGDGAVAQEMFQNALEMYQLAVRESPDFKDAYKKINAMRVLVESVKRTPKDN